MDLQTLVELGLTRREAGAYLALLGCGEASAGELARLVHESRTNVYDSLCGLVKKGLASYVTRGKSTYYRAAEPQKLLDFLLEKQKSLEEALPRLSSMQNSYKKKPLVQVYEGKEGIKTVFSDVLREGKEFVVFGASGRLRTLYPEYAKTYMRERKKRSIRSRQLCAEGSKIMHSPLTKYRTTPREVAGPASTMVYGDKVALLLWFTEPPVAVLIESKEAAHAYWNYFEFVWKLVGESQRSKK